MSGQRQDDFDAKDYFIPALIHYIYQSYKQCWECEAPVSEHKQANFMKKVLLYVMSVFYIVAGIAHFVFTEKYLSVMPPWLPWHNTLIYLSGILEILYGLLLLPRLTRRLASLLIISLLIAVFPVNIFMAIEYYKHGNPHLWLALLRLPLQFVLIYWAYLYTKGNLR